VKKQRGRRGDLAPYILWWQ